MMVTARTQAVSMVFMPAIDTLPVSTALVKAAFGGRPQSPTSREASTLGIVD